MFSFCVNVIHAALRSYLGVLMLFVSHGFSALREKKESDDTAETQSRGSELLLSQAQIHIFYSFSFLSLFFFSQFFISDDISPSEDKAAFNLLPNSLVHQK